MPMLAALIAVVAIAVLVTAWLLWRFSRPRNAAQTQVAASSQAEIEPRPEFPPAGLLVPEGVLRSAGSGPTAIWDALEATAVPVAVEYFPVTASEIATFRTVPVNAAAQRALVDIVKALDPRSPTSYRVVLPTGQGAQVHEEDRREARETSALGPRATRPATGRSGVRRTRARPPEPQRRGSGVARTNGQRNPPNGGGSG
jgi:hypothetical protein